MNNVFSISLNSPLHPRQRPVRTGKGVFASIPAYVGSSENALAKFASDLFEGASTQFDPIMFVGPTGVGKSHLSLGMRSIR